MSFYRQTFCDAHKGATGPLAIDRDRARLYFPDGATMESSSYGNTFDPPADRYERQKLIVKYWTCLVQRRFVEFEQMKKGLAGWARNFQQGACHGGPGAEQLDQLKELGRELEGFKMILDVHKKELERVTPKHVREKELTAVASQQDASGFITELEKLRF